MAAPLAAGAKLLIKPVLNALKKAAIKKAAATGGAKAAGLGVKEITKLTNLDVLNLVRAKAVQGTKAEVAKSLGISVKELNATLADIKLTEARKRAVKGANYIKNANRFVKDPVKTISGQGKRKIVQAENKLLREIADKKNDRQVEEDKGAAQRIELDLLQATLYDVSRSLELSEDLWDMADKLDLDHLRNIRYNVELDMNATVSATGGLDDFDFVIVTEENGGKGGGYREGVTFDDYLSYLEGLITNGSASLPHVGGLL